MKSTINSLKSFLLTMAMLAFVATSFAQKTDPNTILGLWVTEKGKSVVKVYKKDDGKFYAKIIWLKEPNEEDGTAKVDKENPDESLRKQPIIGLEFMKGFVYDADDEEWEGDYLYDPESGNVYSGYMTMKNKNMLALRGYVGISLLGRTSEWMRKDKIE